MSELTISDDSDDHTIVISTIDVIIIRGNPSIGEACTSISSVI